GRTAKRPWRSVPGRSRQIAKILDAFAWHPDARADRIPEVETSLYDTARIFRAAPGVALRHHLSWPETFWFAVASTLRTGGPWLRSCSGCGSLFVRRRRQQYCQRRCSQTARTRIYRANLRRRKRNPKHRIDTP